MFDDASADAEEQWQAGRAQTAYREAVEDYRIGNLVKARLKAEQALSLDEHHHAARILVAKVHIEQGRYQSAIDELETVVGDRPDDVEPIFLLGVAHEKAGHLEYALQDYRRAYEIDPKHFGAILAAAEILVLMDRLEDATSLLNAHLSRADNDPAAYELAGRLALMGEDYPAAVEHYRRASKLDPENVDYRESVAISQVYAGQHAEAISTLKDLVDRRDNETPLWIHAMLGDCYLATGASGKAARHYEAVCRIDPDAEIGWLSLAKIYVMQNRVGDAADACLEALTVSPDCVEATSLMGYLLLKAGYAAEAVDLLAVTQASHGDDATLQCVLGRAYTAVGQAEDAQNCYAEAVRLEPENTLAWRLLRDTMAPPEVGP